MPATQPEAKACLGGCFCTTHRSGTKATQARRPRSTLGKARAKRMPLAAASAVCLRRTIEGRNVPWRERKRKYTRSRCYGKRGFSSSSYDKQGQEQGNDKKTPYAPLDYVAGSASISLYQRRWPPLDYQSQIL